MSFYKRKSDTKIARMATIIAVPVSIILHEAIRRASTPCEGFFLGVPTVSRAFSEQWKVLVSDDQLQQKLGKNIRELALPNATTTIVDHIEKLLHG